MSFYDEIKNYSIEDLRLIIETQQDLYTEEEMAQIKELLDKKAEEAIKKELRKKALEEETGRHVCKMPCAGASYCRRGAKAHRKLHLYNAQARRCP